jgi:hypothetical protein
VSYAALEAKVKDSPKSTGLESLFDCVNVGDDILHLLFYKPSCHDRHNMGKRT